jgi:PAS domain S-box-containing protein
MLMQDNEKQQAQLIWDLQAANERYESLFEGAGDSILIVDAETLQILEANTNVVRRLGYSREELLQMTITDIEEDCDSDSADNLEWTSTFSGTRVYECEFRRKDGSLVPVEVSSRFTKQNQREVLQIFARNITERKRMQARLRESEENYRSLTTHLPVGIYRNNIDGQILFANPALVQMLGYDSLEELQTTTAISRYADPIEREKQLETWKTQRGIVQQEITLQRKDGNTIWVRDIGQIIFDADGEIVHIEGILEDITDRKKAKKKADEAEQRYRALFEQNNDAVVITSLDGIVIDVNPQVKNKWDLEPGRIISKHIETFVAPEDLEDMVKRGAALRSGEDVPIFECQLVDKDGGIILAEINSTLVYDPEGNPTHVHIIFRDITERKRVEDALAEERYLLNTVLDNLPVQVYVKDRESRFLLANTATMQAMRGVTTPEDYIGKTDFDLMSDQPEFAAAYFAEEQAIIQTGEAILNKEHLRYTTVNTPLWGVTSKLPMRDAEGHITGIVGIGMDITERKNAENALRESLATTQTLYDASRILIAIKDLPDLLQTVVDNLVTALSADRMILISVDLEAERVTEFVKGGPGSHDVVRATFDDLRNGLTIWVLREGKPVLSPKGIRDPRESLELQLRRLETDCGDIIVVPLHYRGKMLGTLTAINRPEQRDFTQQNVELMVAMANQAAIAIENARLVYSLRESLATTKTLYHASSTLIELKGLPDLLQIVVDNLVTALPADRVALITVDLDEGRATQFVVSGPGSHHIVQVPFDELNRGLTGWVLREGKPTLSPKDTPDPREGIEVQRRRLETNCGDIIVVPLNYRGKTRGTLTAINRPEQRDFTEKDVDLMVALANQAAIAIENSRLVYSLRASEEKFFKAFRASPDPMIISSLASGRYIDINESFLSTTGYTREEVISSTLFELQVWANPEERERLVQMVQEQGAVRNFEAAFKTKSGEVGFLLMSSEIIELNHKKCLLTVSKNITEHKQAEQQRLELAIERERIQILSNFITEASHEFKTPLSIVNTSAYLLGKTTDPDKQGQQIHQIKDQVKSITKLVDALTLMTKLDSGGQDFVLVEIDLNEILRVVCHGIQSAFQEENLDCLIELSEKPMLLRGDSGYLKQALQHILDNAVHCTQEGDRITIRSYQRAGHAIIEIIDTGDGISDDDLPHIFERFYRADKAGTTRGFGLGLPIAKAIVELHQGRIELESEAGKGSTFRILIPVSE